MIGQVITYYNHVLIKYYKTEKPRGQSLKIKQHGPRPKMARHGNTGAMGPDTGRRGAGARMAPRDPAFVLDAGTSALPKNPGRHICVRQRPMRRDLHVLGRADAVGERQGGLGTFQGVIQVCHRNFYIKYSFLNQYDFCLN